MDEKEILARQLSRAKKEIVQLESIIEDRSRSLFLAEKELRETAEFVSHILTTLRSAVIVVNSSGEIVQLNPAGVEILQAADSGEIVGAPLQSFVYNSDGEDVASASAFLGDHREAIVRSASGVERHVLIAGTELHAEESGAVSMVFVAADISDKKRMEVDLRHAQKLESVGQLAAGIAHEINTPVQFVGDSLTFLEEAHGDLAGLWEAYEALKEAAKPYEDLAALVERVESQEECADKEFLDEETPEAFRRAIDGVQRVAKIVSAMKEFAHPGDHEMAPADLNRAISTTLTVARAEYKYIAEMETDFEDLPPVVCHVGDINQVVLNLVVNAAHAVEARFEGSDSRGKIRVQTRRDDDSITISVSDNGSGIPPGVVERIFDPFFTTKEVGRGTGQGLALTHSIIVERHHGKVTVDTVEGEGTTFHVRIPVKQEVARDAA